MKNRVDSRTKRRMLYAGTIVAALAMVGGFAMASFTFTSSVSAQQGEQNVAVSAVAQLSYTSTSLTSGQSPAAAGTTSGTASAVGTTAETYCVSLATCSASDDAEVIAFAVAVNPSSTAAYTFHLTISVDAGGTTTTSTTYFTEAASATASTLTLVYDLGSASPGAVTSVNIIGNSP